MNRGIITMVGESDLERVRGARRKLAQVRHILMTPAPEQLAGCGPVLEAAVEILGYVERGQETRKPLPILMDELRELQRELSVVTALMQQAAGYYLGWAQMLGAAIGGYTPYGEAAPLTGRSHVSVEG
jgi:hypothetical protein